MDSFGHTKAEIWQMKRAKEANLVKKNEEMIIVDPTRIIEACTEALKAANVTMSYPALAIPLLAMCGRRQTEIMGKGQFAPGPIPMSARFTGQLKKKDQTDSYIIPLLCNYD
eukprot:6709001-Prymnesium_polylepis.1